MCPAKRNAPNLTDARWALLAPHILPDRPGGRTRRWSGRELVNGIRSVLRDGCP